MAPLLIDGAQVLLTRWREKRPLMAGDRCHIYDRLIARGWSLPAVLLLYSGSTLLFTLIGSLLFTT
jgi:UDP-N-acetylmuramyl pentapeptide phosphotransferase/UDP-N-acetylglucosamine-1-phosphate transferase